jgi:hypothetical protein
LLEKRSPHPKIRGGLGLKNLRVMNEALLIKHLHKFYNKEDIPSVQLIWNTHYADGQIPHASSDKGSFWFRDIMKYSDHFRGVATTTIGQGDTILLWGDVWNGHHLVTKLPRLYSYAKSNRTYVAQYCNNMDVHKKLSYPHIPIGSPGIYLP